MKPTSKNVLITGVSTGIGFSLCQEFISKGYQVYGSVRKQADATTLQKQLGKNFHPLLFDVTDYQAVDVAAKELTDQLGDSGLDVLINNAGIAVGGPLMHIPIEELKYQFEVNIFGLIKVTQAFLPLLGGRQNHPCSPGVICNISSVAGQIAMPFIGPYVGSKHALEGISNSMRRELMLYGIDVVIIGPGAIKTPIWNKGMQVEYQDTPFAVAIKNFADRLIRPVVKSALEPDFLAAEIYKIAINKKRKIRYAFVPSKLMGWIIPRMLAPRVLDRFIAKKIGL